MCDFPPECGKVDMYSRSHIEVIVRLDVRGGHEGDSVVVWFEVIGLATHLAGTCAGLETRCPARVERPDGSNESLHKTRPNDAYITRAYQNNETM